MRMAKIWLHKWKCLVFAMTFILVCAVLMKHSHLIFSQDTLSSTVNWISFTRAKTPHNRAHSQPMVTYKSQENFRCYANEIEVIPHLSQALQNFLRYRHCRAYPTLLTPSPCEDDLYLLFVIKSTGINVERRAAVRDTWGDAGRIQGRRIKLVFLMGRSEDLVLNNKLQPLLEWESRRYGDILQWDFVDIFYNLTLKELGMLSWVSHKCSKAQFVFKGDDDVFVNTDNLIEFLRDHRPENHLLAGYIQSSGMPIRDTQSKYFIPVELFEGKQYPPFPSGGGYLMSQQTVLDLHVTAQRVKRFPLDDVFLGMCLYEMGVKLAHHNSFLTFGFSSAEMRFNPCAYHKIMMVHKFDPVEMRVMWLLMQGNKNC